MGKRIITRARPSNNHSQDHQGDPSVDENRLQDVASAALQLSWTTRKPPTSTPMPSPQPSMESAVPAPQHVIIDPEGNRTIRHYEGDRKFTYLVCSRTLELASPVFDTISLNEDHLQDDSVIPDAMRMYDMEFKPWAMEAMLRALHHQQVIGLDKSDPVKLAEFALHCEVYCCAKPLAPWACEWAYQCKVKNTRDVGHLFLAGVVLDSEVIQGMAKKHIHLVNPVEVMTWKSDPVLSRLPDAKYREVTLELFHALKRVIRLMYKVVQDINDSEDEDHIYYICEDCGIVPDHFIIDCDNEFGHQLCTKDTRLLAVFEVMKQSGVLISDDSDHQYSAKQMADMLLVAIHRTDYECPHGCACSYYEQVQNFALALAKI